MQFGAMQLPNASLGGDWTQGLSSYAGGILPPPSGLSAMLVTKPDLIPESLTTALGCATATDKTVKTLCSEAENYGGKYNQVYALAQNVGQVTNFDVNTWTQRIDVKLINPLLGNYCTIGNADQPIVVNPYINVGPGLNTEQDPDPAKHPDTGVLDINDTSATDTTFAAPGVTGCGPGGAANVPIDEALDAGTGLPAASGVNSLALTGTFEIAYCFYSKNQAKILLAAFLASRHGEGPRESARRISTAELHTLLQRTGIR